MECCWFFVVVIIPTITVFVTLINIIFGSVIVGFLRDVMACRGVCVNAATFAMSLVCYCMLMLTGVHKLLLLR
jgi:hypothetical protein